SAITGVGLVDRRDKLLQREGRERRADPRREDAAGRDQLDRLGTGTDLLADGPAQPVRPVELAGEPDVVPVTTGDRERAAGRDDPWPGEPAGRDRPRELDRSEPTEVPDGRHAGGQLLPGVHRALERPDHGGQL